MRAILIPELDALREKLTAALAAGAFPEFSTPYAEQLVRDMNDLAAALERDGQNFVSWDDKRAP